MIRKLSIVAVFLLFSLPVILATLLHTEWLEWRPTTLRNHGEFVSPVVPVYFAALTTQSGHPLQPEDLLDKWFLIRHHLDACDADCLESFFWLRQVRAAQDRHQGSIGLMLISPNALSEAALTQIQAWAPDTVVVTGTSAAALAQALSSLTEPEEWLAAPHWTYLSDPMGNIMMRYPNDADPNGIRRDLRRLLTWTQRD